MKPCHAVASNCLHSLPAVQSADTRKWKTPPLSLTPNLPRVYPETVGEFLLHTVVAQKLHGIGSGSSISKELQNQITTQTNAGLSWLFGKGLKYWQSTALETILDAYEIPSEAHDAVGELHEWFKAVGDDPLFGSSSYSDFRTSVGGKIDSWIANYCNQLEGIEKAIEDIDPSWKVPEELQGDRSSHYLSNTGLKVTQLTDKLKLLADDRKEVRICFARLMGQDDALPSQHDIKVVDGFSKDLDGLAGVFATIQNLVKQENTDDSQHQSELEETFKIPDWLKPLPKINQISGGVPEIENELQDDRDKFHALRRQVNDQLEKIVKWGEESGQGGNPVDVLAEREERRFPGSENPQIQARRWMLHDLSRRAITGTDSLKRNVHAALMHLFVDAKSKKNLNRLLFNDRGSIYRSPASRSRHQALGLDESLLLNMDILELVKQVHDKAKKDFEASPDLDHHKDLLQIESLMALFQMYGLPDKIPTKLVEKEKLDELTKIPPPLRTALGLDVMQREALIRCMNLYTSEMLGVLARLFRKSFVLKAKFLRVNANRLFYVPKERDQAWQPPPHYYSSTSHLSKLIQAEFPEGLKEGISSESIVDFVESGRFKKWKGKGLEDFLAQAPHDWFLDLGIKGLGKAPLKGIPVDKAGIRDSAKEITAPVRLVGASSYKTVVDQWMKQRSGSKTLALGEYNLMFYQTFDQQTSIDEAGNPEVSATPCQDVSAEVALTVTDNFKPSVEIHPLSETVIGIDLGQAGIGYAVFDVKDIENIADAQPICSGTIPIRSIRNLIKAVKHHKGRVQPRQKFQQKHSTALEQLRDNVVGDVAHHIDGLCREYRGFPVLESSVRYLASGGKKLQLVYDRVLNLYTFSKIDAHQNVRRHHWCGGLLWEHPYLSRERKKQDKDGNWQGTGKWDVLKLHPGVTVHPYGTSQVCTRCSRNPIEIVRRSKEKSFTIEEGGKVQLPEGTLLLKRKLDPNMSKGFRERQEREYRRKKLRQPYQYPVEPRTMKTDELIAKVKDQLRRPHESTRSRDTTQSRYFCPFEGCQNEMHADENAAINIARKWVSDKGIKLAPDAAKML